MAAVLIGAPRLTGSDHSAGASRAKSARAPGARVATGVAVSQEAMTSSQSRWVAQCKRVLMAPSLPPVTTLLTLMMFLESRSMMHLAFRTGWEWVHGRGGEFASLVGGCYVRPRE